jgi:hypothetical protein
MTSFPQSGAKFAMEQLKMWYTYKTSQNKMFHPQNIPGSQPQNVQTTKYPN